MCSVVNNGSLFKYHLVIAFIKPRPKPSDLTVNKPKKMCTNYSQELKTRISRIFTLIIKNTTSCSAKFNKHQ